MTIFLALLRAVNVGGTGKLPMTRLRALCEDAGFRRATTYIQSGNVVFESDLAEAKVKATLEKVLLKELRKPCGVLVRTQAELEEVVRKNPFKKAAPNQLLVLFLDEPPPANALEGVKIPGREEMNVEGRELYIHFPDGMGASKLKVPFAGVGTGRNLNTVSKLIELAGAMTTLPRG